MARRELRLIGSLFAIPPLVATSAWTAPRIGVGAFFATLIAAQLIAAIALDHFGMIGMEVRPATLMRVAGAGFLVLGALLVVRG